MKKGDKATVLGMQAEVANVDGEKVTYLLGSEKIEVVVANRKTEVFSPSRAAPGTSS